MQNAIYFELQNFRDAFWSQRLEGGLFDPKRRKGKTAVVERSTIKQLLSILRFVPTQYVICIVLSSQMEGRSKTFLWCAMLLLLHIIPRSELNAYHQKRRRICVLPRKELWESIWRRYFVEKRRREMRRVGVKRFHGVQRHSRRPPPPAQMAVEIEKLQKSNNEKKLYYFKRIS